MRYLSFDIEATGLGEKDYIIEFAMIPFDAKQRVLEEGLSKHFYIKCPSFDSMKKDLDPWVIEHNEELIKKAHKDGIEIERFKRELEIYVTNPTIKEYFQGQKITLFGKSMNAIDLPFMNRDLGWEFMRKHFNHRVHDLTSVTYSLIDLKCLPAKCESGSELMKHFNMGHVAHTALEDARNTALMYFKMLKQFSNKKS
ncbi:exonuclease domain-containing protein [Halobacteriovorax sp. GB3]|uniref:exonuclease domain-containing protein n=1 Tax=Halobacteriovorax sp. GB3 TaxID=2719615 RepID=UPI00235DD2F4|nr:exonuclease domain-containing protein [Halobacteriovorax sp. GB3]MDD0852691.1 exonuclease domain-containing protein [Halobacteriovorax sp. GB3]